MDTKGMLRATTLQLAEEDDFAIDLLHRDVVILDTGEVLLHLIQFMIVRSKERARMTFGILVQIFHDGPGYWDAIISRSATPQLIEENQRARRHII